MVKRIEVSKRFAALEDLDAEIEINSALETIRENTKMLTKESLDYYEIKKHKPWFDELLLMNFTLQFL
jgi:hypothetical protein